MESVLKIKIASRGWHFYGKTPWKNPKKNKVCMEKRKTFKIALIHDPYAVAGGWKVKEN